MGYYHLSYYGNVNLYYAQEGLVGLGAGWEWRVGGSVCGMCEGEKGVVLTVINTSNNFEDPGHTTYDTRHTTYDTGQTTYKTQDIPCTAQEIPHMTQNIPRTVQNIPCATQDIPRATYQARHRT